MAPSPSPHFRAARQRPPYVPRTPLLRLLVGMLGMLALVAGCAPRGSDRSFPPPSAPDPASSFPLEAGHGDCAGATTPPAGVLTRELAVAGTTRTYLVAVPASYSGTRPVPIVLNFHGYASNAIQQAAYSRLNEFGSRRGFLVVTPQGSGSPARWSLPGTIPGDDEVAFVGALLDELRASWCVDEERVYATGMSNGAAFAARLACQLGGRIAAIAPVAGINLVEPCETGAPVSVIAFHGTADHVVPYGGGRVADRFSVRSVPEAIREWAEHARCARDADEDAVSEHVRRRAYGDCAAGTVVRLYTIEGGGHTWPGAADLPPLGPVTDEVDATRLMLDFFDGEPRSGHDQPASDPVPPAPLALV